jgi:hypothetical protein
MWSGGEGGVDKVIVDVRRSVVIVACDRCPHCPGSKGFQRLATIEKPCLNCKRLNSKYLRTHFIALDCIFVLLLAVKNISRKPTLSGLGLRYRNVVPISSSPKRR